MPTRTEHNQGLDRRPPRTTAAASQEQNEEGNHDQGGTKGPNLGDPAADDLAHGGGLCNLRGTEYPLLHAKSIINLTLVGLVDSLITAWLLAGGNNVAVLLLFLFSQQLTLVVRLAMETSQLLLGSVLAKDHVEASAIYLNLNREDEHQIARNTD